MPRFVVLGKHSDEWLGRQPERSNKVAAKAKELGLDIKSSNYTQGIYDFVDVIDAADRESVMAFSIWYRTQGFGDMTTMAVFQRPEFEAIGKTVGVTGDE
ncbi:MAG: GYD domain-containing protein [Alphaproteobacteria bacterium]